MLLVNLFLVCLAIGLGAANEQKVRNGTWVSEKNWVFNKKLNRSVVLSGSSLSTKFQPGGIMLNAMYKGIVANETNKWYYWEFNCVKNCFGVGITKKDYYDSEGLWIQGVFFSYHLSTNGRFEGRTYVAEFGDGIKDGDRIGFILNTGEQELKVYIVHNDRPLGLALVKKAPYASELYPAVLIFISPGTVEINEKKNVSTDHLLVRTDYPEKGIRGEYKLVKMNGNQWNGELFIMKFDKPEGEGNKIPAWMYYEEPAYPTSNGEIVKQGKDAEGDLYEYIQPNFCGRSNKCRVMGRARDDSRTIFKAIGNLRRVKFSEIFDDLTIISYKPNVTMLFKRFFRERPYFNTSRLPETSDLLT